MRAANEYAWKQVLGSLARRGALVEAEGTVIVGTFTDATTAGLAWLALGEKYPHDGPKGVKTSREGLKLTFSFVPEPSTIPEP